MMDSTTPASNTNSQCGCCCTPAMCASCTNHKFWFWAIIRILIVIVIICAAFACGAHFGARMGGMRGGYHSNMMYMRGDMDMMPGCPMMKTMKMRADDMPMMHTVTTTTMVDTTGASTTTVATGPTEPMTGELVTGAAQ